jgi:hypothetical protein
MLRSTAAFAAAFVLTTAAVAPATASVRTLSHAKAAPDAEVRVVHGSPDAGPVTVAVNGTAVLTNFLYGTVTSYIALPAGTYTLTVTTAAGAQVTLTATLTGGTDYSVVATGELSPAAAPSKPNIALTAYVDKPFVKGTPALNFHHAAPVTGPSAEVPFGYGLLADPKNAKLGEATFGNETGPLKLPASALGAPFELYAVSVDAITLIPNQIAPADFKNELPAKSGANISAYAIDGPAAASVPTVAGTDAVRLVGAFDKAGI